MKPRATTALAALLLAAAGAAAAQTATPSDMVPQEIGSWRLACVVDRMTDRGDCMLRHRDPVERAQSPGGSSLLLEVQDRGGQLLPVVTSRDLTIEAVGRGLMAVTGIVQLRFPPNRLFELPCTLEGRTLACVPRAEDAARAAQELATAPTALIRVTGFGSATAQSEPIELALERTPEALSRFRARVPEGSAPPPAAGLTLPEILRRLQLFLGL